MTLRNPFLGNLSSPSTSGAAITTPVISSVVKSCSSAAQRRRRQATDNTLYGLKAGAEVLLTVNLPSASIGQLVNATPIITDGFIYSVFNLSSPGHLPMLLRVTPKFPRNIDVYVRRNETPSLTTYDRLLFAANASEHDYTLYLAADETLGVDRIVVGVRSAEG